MTGLPFAGKLRMRMTTLLRAVRQRLKQRFAVRALFARTVIGMHRFKLVRHLAVLFVRMRVVSFMLVTFRDVAATGFVTVSMMYATSQHRMHKHACRS